MRNFWLGFTAAILLSPTSRTDAIHQSDGTNVTMRFITIGPNTNRYDVETNSAQAYLNAPNSQNKTLQWISAVSGKTGQNRIAAEQALMGYAPSGQHENWLGEDCVVYQHIEPGGGSVASSMHCITDDDIMIHYGILRSDGTVDEDIPIALLKGDAGPESDWQIPAGAKLLPPRQCDDSGACD